MFLLKILITFFSINGIKMYVNECLKKSHGETSLGIAYGLVNVRNVNMLIHFKAFYICTPFMLKKVNSLLNRIVHTKKFLVMISVYSFLIFIIMPDFNYGI